MSSVVSKAVQKAQHGHTIACHEAQATSKREAAKRCGCEAEPNRLQQEAAAHERAAVRLRSAAGDGCHEWATECPSLAGVKLNDREFLFAVRWRLGLPVRQEGHCQHRNSQGDNKGDWCGKLCDRWGDHAVLCGKGRGRYRSHGAVCKCLQRQGQRAGLEADLEEVCPELLQGEPGTPAALEARLDVHLWGHDDEPREAWIDATVTHPYKATGRAKAARQDGAAVQYAENKKHQRYTAGTSGVSCTPFGLEAWGRLGVHARAVLELLATARAKHTRGCRPRILQQMRAELGASLMRALAETVSQSCRGEPQQSEAPLAGACPPPVIQPGGRVYPGAAGEGEEGP